MRLSIPPCASLLLLLCGCPDSSKPVTPPIPTTCVLVGTLVATPSGPRPIESLVAGDLVISKSATGERTHGAVVRTLVGNRERHLQLRVGTYELAVTADHPLATELGWVLAGALEAGDRVWTDEGLRSVLSIAHVESASQVVDLTVEPDANFYAAGVLVHNKTPPRLTDEQKEQAKREQEYDALLQSFLAAATKPPGPSGWREYVEPRLLTPDLAEKFFPPLGGGAEAAVLAFFASRMRGDDVFRQCLVSDPDAALSEALPFFERIRCLEVRLLQRAEIKELSWIRVELLYQADQDERRAIVDVGLTRHRVTGWAICALPSEE